MVPGTILLTQLCLVWYNQTNSSNFCSTIHSINPVQWLDMTMIHLFLCTIKHALRFPCFRLNLSHIWVDAWEWCQHKIMLSTLQEKPWVNSACTVKWSEPFKHFPCASTYILPMFLCDHPWALAQENIEYASKRSWGSDSIRVWINQLIKGSRLTEGDTKFHTLYIQLCTSNNFRDQELIIHNSYQLSIL